MVKPVIGTGASQAFKRNLGQNLSTNRLSRASIPSILSNHSASHSSLSSSSSYTPSRFFNSSSIRASSSSSSSHPLALSSSLTHRSSLHLALHLSQKRFYSRDPLRAEHEASTVRGHRSERARTELLKAQAVAQKSAKASPSDSASSGSTGGANNNGSNDEGSLFCELERDRFPISSCQSLAWQLLSS